MHQKTGVTHYIHKLNQPIFHHSRQFSALYMKNLGWVIYISTVNVGGNSNQDPELVKQKTDSKEYAVLLENIYRKPVKTPK